MSTRNAPAALLSVLLLLSAVHGTDASAQTAAERGKYLVTIMGCTDCHTDGALAGRPNGARFLAGSAIGFGGPDGVVYPPNLTSDADTGLGRWTDAQIVAAMRTGLRPDGRILAPIMPWPGYSHLTDEDAQAIVAYLRSLPPVAFRVPAPVPSGESPRFPYLALEHPQP